MTNEQMITFQQAVEFNTGRHYAPNGQIIRCELVSVKPCPILPDVCRVATVEFRDVTRRIRGVVQVEAQDGNVASFADVLAAYDAGKYELA